MRFKGRRKADSAHYSGIYRRDIPAPARPGYTCQLRALQAGGPLAFYDHAVTAVRGIYDRRIHTPPILDSGHFFPAAARFAGAWQDIRREALAVAGMLPNIPRFHELMPQQADISANDGRDWRMFMMKVYGVPMKRTWRAARPWRHCSIRSPEVVSAVLSFLAPGKHIPAHRGPFRAILRYHLMLSMPSDAAGRPACELRIDGEPYLLGDGESLLWDDTYTHEVWNRSDQVRIALLLDVWRRDMPADVALMSRALMGAAKMWLKTRGLSYAG